MLSRGGGFLYGGTSNHSISPQKNHKSACCVLEMAKLPTKNIALTN